MYSFKTVIQQRTYVIEIYYELPFTTSAFEYEMLNQSMERKRNKGHYLTGKANTISLLY